MFKKSERLTRSEFTAFFATGKRQHFPHVTVIHQPYPTRKVAVVVGKKVATSAVQRNKYKRRILGVLYQELGKRQDGGVLILLVKPSFRTLTRKDAQAELKSVIAQVTKSA